MFGYVTPCKMELKMKDYEKFKSYYCGLCLSIKKDFGNIPRMTLNYDMAFLGILLDSLTDSTTNYKKFKCLVHPLKNKISVINNNALDYAAFCNIVLSYFKLVDNVNDDNSKISKIASLFLKKHIFKQKDPSLKEIVDYIDKSLKDLSEAENSASIRSIDEISHSFADLTGYIISFYLNNNIPLTDNISKEALYWLGYNLGKWIYLIDAFDDLEKDMLENKFNAINKVYNVNNLNFKAFSKEIEDKIDFLLTSCASQCLEHLSDINLSKNEDLLYNILQLGLMEKMDTVFKRSEFINAKSV